MKRTISTFLLLLSLCITGLAQVTWPPSTGNGVFTPFGTAYFPNLTPVQIYQSNLSTGDHAIFTVPTGKKAFIVVGVENVSGVGNILSTPKISLDGGSTYITINGTATIANGGGTTNGGQVWSWIGNAGDVYGLTTATNNGLNVFGTAYVFDASSPLKTVRLSSFSNGDNTLYTVPAGKAAFPVFGYATIMASQANSPFLGVTTTASVAIKVNIVQSGGSVATTNQIFTGTIATSVNGPGWHVTMAAGDFININTAAGANTALAWATICEYTP